MTRRLLCGTLLLALAIAHPSRAEQKHVFAGREWTIDLPATYTNESSAELPEKGRTIGFAPDPREDGSRPLIQVTLFPVPAGEKPAEFLDRFAELVIGGVQRRRDDWKVERSEVDVAGRRHVRYAWTGVTVPASDGASIRAKARGIMLLGVDDQIAYALHTQDIDDYSRTTVPANEAFLKTFALHEAPSAAAVPPAPERRVTDLASVLSADETAALESELEAIDQRGQAQMIIYIAPAVPSGQLLEDFTLRAANAWGVGRADVDDGIILFVFIADRKVRIELGEGAAKMISDDAAARIIADDIAPHFRRKEYAQGLHRAIEKIERLLKPD